VSVSALPGGAHRWPWCVSVRAGGEYACTSGRVSAGEGRARLASSHSGVTKGLPLSSAAMLRAATSTCPEGGTNTCVHPLFLGIDKLFLVRKSDYSILSNVGIDKLRVLD
jgi:hypothetical protein